MLLSLPSPPISSIPPDLICTFQHSKLFIRTHFILYVLKIIIKPTLSHTPTRFSVSPRESFPLNLLLGAFSSLENRTLIYFWVFFCRLGLWEQQNDDLELRLDLQAEAEEEEPPWPRLGQGFPRSVSAGRFPNSSLGDLPNGAELSLRWGPAQKQQYLKITFDFFFIYLWRNHEDLHF